MFVITISIARYASPNSPKHDQGMHRAPTEPSPWSRLKKINIRDLPLSGKLQSDLIQLEQSDSWCRRRKRNYAMSIKRLFDAVERRGDIGRRVAALVLPISNRPRVTSSCTGKIGLREPGEHARGPNLASRDNVAHNHNLYTILETPPPVIPLCRKQARTTQSRIPTGSRSTSSRSARGCRPCTGPGTMWRREG